MKIQIFRLNFLSCAHIQMNLHEIIKICIRRMHFSNLQLYIELKMLYQVSIGNEMTKTIPLVNLISFRLNYRNNDHFNDTNHAWQCKDELNTNSITLLITEKCIPTSNIQTELTISFVFDLRVFLIHMRNLLFQINFNLAIFGRFEKFIRYLKN